MTNPSMNWQSEANKLSQAMQDPTSSGNKPIMVIGNPKSIAQAISKPATTTPNIMSTLSPRVRSLAMRMQQQGRGGMPGMPPGMPGMPPGMPPMGGMLGMSGMPGMMGMTAMTAGMPLGMPGMPPGMPPRTPPMGRGQSDALRGLLGALIASRARSPMGMPPGMPLGMPPGMPPGMAGTGMFKSVKKGKTMARSKSQMCSDCGEHESNCSCNYNKNERGRKMGKRYGYGSMHKGFMDDTVKTVRGALSNALHSGTDMTVHGLRRLANFVDSLDGQSGPKGADMMRMLRSMRSSKSSKSPKSENGSAIGAREGALRSSRSNFNGSAIGAREGSFRLGTGPKTPRYTQSIRDPENPNIGRKEKDVENRNNRATSNARNASMKDMREMLMAGISGKNYAGETRMRNAREADEMRRSNPSGKNYAGETRAKSSREADEMRRSNPSGRNYIQEANARSSREARDYNNASEGQGSRLYTTRSMSTAKRMSKSISSMMSDGIRHMVGGYSTSRSGSMSKRARPANNTNTTRNKFGY